MRSFRQQILLTAAVFALAAAMLAAFPLEAIAFKASSVRRSSEPAAAFVVLTADDEARAMKSAKTAWQSDTSTRRHVGAHPQLTELPADKAPWPLVDVPKETDLSPKAGYAEYGAGAWTPSEAAGAPEKIASSPDDSGRQAFPREALLGLDKKEDRQ